MEPFFEELDYCPTPIGPVSLRHRLELTLKREVYEIKLGDEFLMSSLFTASEEALARLGVAALDGDGLDVVVGGLGLGYTARAVLEHQTVGSLVVVEMLVPVIDWHRKGLLPLGAGLVADPRCRFIEGDFFELAASTRGFDPQTSGRRFDAILLDIDHSPEALLDERSTSFYQADGLQRACRPPEAGWDLRPVVERSARPGFHRTPRQRLRPGVGRSRDLRQPAARAAVHAIGLSGAPPRVASRVDVGYNGGSPAIGVPERFTFSMTHPRTTSTPPRSIDA